MLFYSATRREGRQKKKDVLTCSLTKAATLRGWFAAVFWPHGRVWAGGYAYLGRRRRLAVFLILCIAALPNVPLGFILRQITLVVVHRLAVPGMEVATDKAGHRGPGGTAAARQPVKRQGVATCKVPG